jgi:hypothetical protein
LSLCRPFYRYYWYCCGPAAPASSACRRPLRHRPATHRVSKHWTRSVAAGWVAPLFLIDTGTHGITSRRSFGDPGHNFFKIPNTFSKIGFCCYFRRIPQGTFQCPQKCPQWKKCPQGFRRDVKREMGTRGYYPRGLKGYPRGLKGYPQGQECYKGQQKGQGEISRDVYMSLRTFMGTFPLVLCDTLCRYFMYIHAQFLFVPCVPGLMD